MMLMASSSFALRMEGVSLGSGAEENFTVGLFEKEK